MGFFIEWGLKMSNVFDVADYILKRQGMMTTMKLQKLVYYCQAWALVWDSGPIFSEKIKAWRNGPVVWELYDHHRGRYEISSIPEVLLSESGLSIEHQDTIDRVLEHYGYMPSHELSYLTHIEAPWKDARKGLATGVKGDREITPASMAEFYESFIDENQ